MRKLLILIMLVPGTAIAHDLGKPVSHSTGADAIIYFDQSSNRSPFSYRLNVDLPITFTGLFTAFYPHTLNIQRAHSFPMEGLSGRSVNGLDRTVIGNWSPTADGVSDALLVTKLFFPFALNFLDVLLSRSEDGLIGFAKDAAVLLETFAVTMMVSNLTKFSVRRLRPFAYGTDGTSLSQTGDNTFLSFFSGHTSITFSMATAYSFLFSKRHPRSPWVLPVWLGTHMMAAATAYLRVHAGKHFWSDVLVGATVGSLIGYLVPFLHTRSESNGRRDLDLRVTPLFFQEGFGVSAMLVW